MKVTYGGATYECDVAVKCENDKYIKLYDESGVEIAAFYGISDFSEYSISGGSFISPCDCTKPISLSTYAIGGRTITTDDWILSDSGQYYHEIESGLISANATTCNILLLFADDPDFTYSATQEVGKIVLYTDTAPDKDIVIDSIQITRV